MENTNTDRSRAWRRYKDYTKAKRKSDIDKSIHSWSNWLHPWYNNLHQYSKNKIHCSCPICSAKTRNKGKRKHRWCPALNYTMMDLRNKMAMDADEEDYFLDEILKGECIYEYFTE